MSGRTSPIGLPRLARSDTRTHPPPARPHPRQPNHQPDALSTNEGMAPPLGAVSQADPTSNGMSSTPPAAMTSTASRPPTLSHPHNRAHSSPAAPLSEPAKGYRSNRPPRGPAQPGGGGVRDRGGGVRDRGGGGTNRHPPTPTPPQEATTANLSALHTHTVLQHQPNPEQPPTGLTQPHSHNDDALRQTHLTHHELGQRPHEHTPTTKPSQANHDDTHTSTQASSHELGPTNTATKRTTHQHAHSTSSAPLHDDSHPRGEGLPAPHALPDRVA